VIWAVIWAVIWRVTKTPESSRFAQGQARSPHAPKWCVFTLIALHAALSPRGNRPPAAIGNGLTSSVTSLSKMTIVANLARYATDGRY